MNTRRMTPLVTGLTVLVLALQVFAAPYENLDLNVWSIRGVEVIATADDLNSLHGNIFDTPTLNTATLNAPMLYSATIVTGMVEGILTYGRQGNTGMTNGQSFVVSNPIVLLSSTSASSSNPLGTPIHQGQRAVLINMGTNSITIPGASFAKAVDLVLSNQYDTAEIVSFGAPVWAVLYLNNVH